MGTFIEVRIDPSKCVHPSGCLKCVNKCPVGVFTTENEKIVTIYDNEDECTFCNVCIETCPKDAIEIAKLY